MSKGWKRFFGIKGQRICPQCGMITKPVLQGSDWMELVLCLMLLVPGIIYSTWRRTATRECPYCRHVGMIATGSPVGKYLIATYHTIEKVKWTDPSYLTQEAQ